MATTHYGVNDPAAVKLWSKRMDAEALYKTVISEYIGKGSSSLIQIQDETQKGAGDYVKFGIRRLATGDGTTENEMQEGNEEAVSRYFDGLYVNELGHAHRTADGKTSIDVQRVPYNLREELYDSLTDWFAARKDTSAFNQLAGNTAETRPKYTGLNATIAPSAGRIIRPGAVSTDQGLGSTNVLTLSMIDKCVNMAENAAPLFRPLKGLGPDVDWLFFVHPDQELSLRADTATAGNWFDLQGKRLQGGELGKNGLYTGQMGVYNRTLLVKTRYLPQGVHSTAGTSVSSTRRAVFCGAQAMAAAFGRGGGPTKYSWQEETFDYARQFGVRVSTIFGMKKTVYNSVDFATIVVPTYAAPAA